MEELALEPVQLERIEVPMRRGIQWFGETETLTGFSHGFFWDMGTGKTPSSLIALERTYEFAAANDSRQRHLLPSLAIVPASAISQWHYEARRWLELHELEVVAMRGDADSRQRRMRYVEIAPPRLVIMSYEIATLLQQWIQSLTWFGLIVDESHRIKNTEALRSRAALSVEACFAYCLTGTPITSRPMDVYNQLRLLELGPASMTSFSRAVHPSPQRCPIRLANADYREIGKVRSLSERAALTGEVNATMSGVFGRPMSQRNVPPERPECLGCELFEGGRYEGECKVGGHVAGKPPVMVRQRKSSAWGSYSSFTNRYAVMETAKAGYSYFKGAKNVAELHRRIFANQWATRLTRSEVGIKEKPTYRYVGLDMDAQQNKLYREVQAGVLERLNIAGELTRFQLQSQLTKLMWMERVAAMPPRDFYHHLDSERKNWFHLREQKSVLGAKQEWLYEFLDSLENGDKVVVFTQWTSVSDPLYARLEKRDWKPLIIRGDQSTSERDRNQYDFNNDPERRIIVCTPSGFESLNLHRGVRSGSCIHVVFMDLSWNPKDILQPIGRVLRFGLEAKVWVWFPYCVGTVDEYKVGRLREKQRVIDQIVEGEVTGNVELFELSDVARIASIT